QTTVALASGGRHRLDVDVCIAVTGSAGPEPQQQQPGTMIVAVETPRRTRVRTLRLPGDRERVLAYAATAALHLCRLALPGAG
ncbi:MAG: CinA family protein, partial [Acidimicrobiia bacterium]